MVLVRGLLTLFFLVLFPFYVTSNLIIQPIQKAAFTTTRESRSPALPPDFSSIKSPRWNVVIVSMAYSYIFGLTLSFFLSLFPYRQGFQMYALILHKWFKRL